MDSVMHLIYIFISHKCSIATVYVSLIRGVCDVYDTHKGRHRRVYRYFYFDIFTYAVASTGLYWHRIVNKMQNVKLEK